MHLANLNSALLQCTLHILDFFWFDIFDVKMCNNFGINGCFIVIIL